MAYIGRRPDEVFRAQATHETFTGDGSTVAFDLSFEAPDNDADVQVFVDNVRQEPGASKSYTIGADGSGDIKRITFNVAPASSAEIYAINPGRDTSLIEPSDASVTTAKLASTAVTTAKITDSNITTAKIAADAITGAKIADDAINSEHITDGSVDNVHLAGSIANAKLSNSSITINGTAVSLGGSVTAGTDWQAVTVADGSTQLTAEAGKGYFLDTNTGVIEVLLPSSPTRGDTVILADYSGTFATNKCIVNTGGKLIDSTEGGPGTSNDFELTTNNQVVEIVFVDNNKGWLVKTNSTPAGLSAVGGGDGYGDQFLTATGGTVTTTGDFKVHTFTGDGCFVVSGLGNQGPDGDSNVDYLVVAGGGGGGGGGSGGDGGGGGGAGGFREGRVSSPDYTASPLVAPSGIPVTAGSTFPITVGGGGAGGTTPGNGSNGSNSVFSTITSTGGGFGKGNTGSPHPAGSGGSGGGGRGGGGVPAVGGSGNTPSTSPAQGTAGGVGGSPTGPNGQSPDNAAGGGGGATQAGDNSGPGDDAGVGGTGATTHITGSPVAYAGGGGGSGFPGGAGGTGGGSAGTNLPSSTPATAGTANTGGGGGGGSNGGTGGKGVVIIRYKFK